MGREKQLKNTDGKTSSRQLVANKRNALKSTGPRSVTGKQRSRWNALKHGLLAQAVIIDGGYEREDPEEFDRLHEQLRGELSPVGTIEEVLVERIATCYWRLRRAQIAEVGEIRQSLDMAQLNRARERLDTFQENRKYLSFDFAQRRLALNSHLLDSQVELLADIIKDLKTERKFHSWMKERLVKTFGYDEDSWMGLVAALVSMAEDGPMEGDNPEDIPPPDECIEKIILVLAEQRKRLENFRKAVKIRDEWADDAYAKSCHLPARHAVDKILRYETTIERQMYRALDQLERLQRQRNGDSVPPPVSVDVSVASAGA